MNDQVTHNYDDQSLSVLTQLFRGRTDGYQWLKDNHRLHLLAVYDSIAHRNHEAIDWLRRNDDEELLLFSCAVNGDEHSAKQLFENGYYKMAAVANNILGDDKAVEWMEKFGLQVYIELAAAIIHLYNRKSDTSMLGGI